MILASVCHVSDIIMSVCHVSEDPCVCMPCEWYHVRMPCLLWSLCTHAIWVIFLCLLDTWVVIIVCHVSDNFCICVSRDDHCVFMPCLWSFSVPCEWQSLCLCHMMIIVSLHDVSDDYVSVCHVCDIFLCHVNGDHFVCMPCEWQSLCLHAMWALTHSLQSFCLYAMWVMIVVAACHVSDAQCVYTMWVTFSVSVHHVNDAQCVYTCEWCSVCLCTMWMMLSLCTPCEWCSVCLYTI